jgi:hypothetical protein
VHACGAKAQPLSGCVKVFDDQTDDQWVKDRIVKCSLSSICYSGHSSFTERRHCLLQSVAWPNNTSCPSWPHSPTYPIRTSVKSMVVLRALSNPQPVYTNSLRAAAEVMHSMSRLSRPLVSHGGCMAYMMKQLSENLATHMRWTVCAIGSTTKYAHAAEYDDPRQRQHIGRWKSNLSGLAPDLLQRFDALLQEPNLILRYRVLILLRWPAPKPSSRWRGSCDTAM